MSSKLLEQVKQNALSKLENCPPFLFYHNTKHTLDVLEQAIRIAGEIDNINETELFLLKVAALYHDIGYLKGHKGHEKESCNVFREDCGEYLLDDFQIKIVENLIMATKIPQKPNTILEMVICDADLDYLGRSDFFSLGDNLRQEFLAIGIVKSDPEWENLQYHFLENHNFWTNSSLKLRKPVKDKHFAEIKRQLSTGP